MRTEKEVLKDFEKLGYKIRRNNTFKYISLKCDTETNLGIIIYLNTRTYELNGEGMFLDMQEHKLLTELFQIWGWL